MSGSPLILAYTYSMNNGWSSCMEVSYPKSNIVHVHDLLCKAWPWVGANDIKEVTF